MNFCAARQAGIYRRVGIACGLADGAGWPIKNAIAKFRPELEEYIKTGKKSV